MRAHEEIRRLRLSAQRLAGPPASSPLEVARALLAMQGQELWSAMWSMGARLPGATWSSVAAAFDRGDIVRSWPLRGTLHIHAAEDVGWLAATLGPKVIAGAARRRAQLGLDDRTLGRATEVALEALAHGPRTRAEMLEAWSRGSVEITGQRGYHLLFHLGATGQICLGPMRDGDQCFAATSSWIRSPSQLSRDEGLGELARRYFTSHGPAPASELAGWAKLTAADARRAIEIARPDLEERSFDGVRCLLGPSLAPARAAHCLSGFDELVLGYRDRSAILEPALADRIVPGGNGVFQPTLVVDGEIVGTWRRQATAKRLRITAIPFEQPSKAVKARLAEAAEAPARFAGLELDLRWS